MTCTALLMVRLLSSNVVGFVRHLGSKRPYFADRSVEVPQRAHHSARQSQIDLGSDPAQSGVHSVPEFEQPTVNPDGGVVDPPSLLGAGSGIDSDRHESRPFDQGEIVP
jgi:hypothetical protein